MTLHQTRIYLRVIKKSNAACIALPFFETYFVVFLVAVLAVFAAVFVVAVFLAVVFDAAFVVVAFGASVSSKKLF